jgi:hypothetical protein
VKPEWFGASRIALCFLISLVLRGSRCGRTTMVDATDRSLRLEQQAGRSCLRRVRHRVVRQWDRAGLSEYIDEETGFLGNVGPGYFPDVTDRRPSI